MFQTGIPLHGSAPQSGGNFKAPVGINASWHAGMGMIPQQFSMMQGSKAIVRNSEGANKDNIMRGSERRSGGDPGRAQRIASLSDRADVLQENGHLTPHQRGLVQIIFRRGDDYLCSRFNEAMTEAESGSTANLMELLRMAERLRELYSHKLLRRGLDKHACQAVLLVHLAVLQQHVEEACSERAQVQEAHMRPELLAGACNPVPSYVARQR